MRIIPLLLVLTVLAGTALATDPTSGLDAEALTIGMYCDLKALFSSNVGLLVGLVVALMGLLKIIQGSTGMGIAFIIGGAAVTALPSLIESFLSGVGSAVSGFSERPDIAPPC